MSHVNTTHHRSIAQKGFSLIEFGIVMILSGLLFAGALSTYTTYMQRAKLEASYKNLYDVNTLIADSWRIDNRYFCPADPTLDPGHANYGIENCATAVALGSCTGGATGVCAVAGRTTPQGDRVLKGMVPIKSIMQAYETQRDALALQLAEATDPAAKEEIRRTINAAKKALSTRNNALAVDGWNNRLTYMVSAAWAVRMEDDAPVLQTQGAVDIMDAEGKRAAENGAHFAVISHGANGNGAYSARGRIRSACTDAGTTERENCDNDGIVIRPAVHSAGANNRETDDLVAYNVNAANELWERVACGTNQMCLRNRNVANVAVGTVAGAIDQKLTVGGAMRATDVKLTNSAAAAVCDTTSANCFSPEYIGGDMMNRCDTLTPTAPNKRWVAKRVTGKTVSGKKVPQIECVEVTMQTYNYTCPNLPATGEPGLISGFENGQAVCYDPCEGAETVEMLDVACPSGMTGTLTYTAQFNCTTRSYDLLGDPSGTCTHNPVNGQCGSANGKNLVSGPHANMCTVGASSPISDTATGWSWTCYGVHGGTNATCTANRPINGSCGSANGSMVATQPNSGLCRSGSATAVTGTGPWAWRCTGSYGGNTVSCSASRIVPPTATCTGTDRTLSYTGNKEIETTGAIGCTDDRAERVTNTYEMRSTGSNGWEVWRTYQNSYLQEGCNPAAFTENTSATRLATFLGTNIATSRTVVSNTPTNYEDNYTVTYKECNPVTGSCGSADGGQLTAAPSGTALCSSGTATAVSGSGPWSWSCNGRDGGSNDSCSATYRQNGSCGTANGANYATAPSGASLCAIGSNTAVSGSGPWTWRCNGVNGGTQSADCTANRIQNGVCGSADGNNYASPPPTASRCTVGSATGFTDAGNYWTWRCSGVNGGAQSGACTANQSIAGACGAAHGSSYTTKPTTGLCSVGTASTVGGSGPWTWTCAGINGGAASGTCSASIANACGTANGGNFASEPAEAQRCKAGTCSSFVSANYGTSQWTWTCNNCVGSVLNTCSANMIVSGACSTSPGMCTSGTASNYNAGSCGGSKTWQCNGAGGGTTANCSIANAACPVDGDCSTTLNACDAGTPGTFNAGSCGGSATWKCYGLNGGIQASCSKANAACAPVVNGVCGTMNNTYYVPQPPAGTARCTAGTATTPTQTSDGELWVWNCTGSGGGSTDSCMTYRTTGGGGGGGGGGCFTPETKVTMADGSYKAISDLKVGDRVKGQTGVNTVTKNTAYTVTSKLYRINGSEAYVTANHPFYTAGGWKAIDVEGALKDHPGVEVTQLEIGDVLLDEKGNEVVLESFVEEDHGEITVYNPSLDGDHTYYARGLLMHNVMKNDDGINQNDL